MLKFILHGFTKIKIKTKLDTYLKWGSYTLLSTPRTCTCLLHNIGWRDQNEPLIMV